MNGLANITALIMIGLVVGALAGAVVLGAAPVTAAGSVSQEVRTGTGTGNHGSCVSSFVHGMLEQVGPGQGIGAWVRAMAHRC